VVDAAVVAETVTVAVNDVAAAAVAVAIAFDVNDAVAAALPLTLFVLNQSFNQSIPVNVTTHRSLSLPSPFSVTILLLSLTPSLLFPFQPSIHSLPPSLPSSLPPSLTCLSLSA